MSVFSIFNFLSPLNTPDKYPDALIMIDNRHNIIDWNRKTEEIFGRGKQELSGRNIAVILDVEPEKLYEAAESGELLVVESINKEEENIVVEISCVKVGKKLLITAREVTKKQKILEKLILEYEKSSRVSRNKNTFILGLSNDFKTPVHSLLGFSQGLLDGICGELSEKQAKYVSIMHKNANTLLNLLMTFLSFHASKMKKKLRI